MFKIIALLCALAVTSSSGQSGQATTAKVVCFYDSSSVNREGLGKVSIPDLEPALTFCTHLFYGYAGINPETNKLISLNEELDLDTGKGHYRTITSLRRRFPHLKIILSVGGNRDENRATYLSLLETSAGRVAFINSAYTMLKTYQFDGLDLAWEFPPNKPKKIRSGFGSFWHKVKKTFGATPSSIDEKWEEHREEFTSLVRELKNALRHEGYQLTLTMLPNVNATYFIDVPALINHLDFVNIAAFDFQTPQRNPKEADFTGPLYGLNDRNSEANINAQVSHWLTFHAPPAKIVLGIPTYGRSWKTTEGSGLTGLPPLPETDGPGQQGPQTRIDGLLSWPEVCAKLPNPANTNLKGEDAPLRKVGDPTKRFGSYAYRIIDSDGNFGTWVSYEDPDTAGNKAGYVRAKGLGGIAIFDLTLDDFRGTCSGDKYPILRAAKYRL